MAIFRSALGKPVDMATLIAKNEKTRAVGNKKVNARGDIIDGYGKVITPVNEVVGDNYAKTVGNKSAQPVRQNQQTVQTRQQPQKSAVPVRELTKSELELEESMQNDLEVEKIKARESGKKNG